MKNVLAILAVALVATAPALAADSIASTDDDEPTMGELAEDIEDLAETLETILTAVRNLAPEVAVVMTIPVRSMSGGAWYKADYYLVGGSTIPGFPKTIAANGKIAGEYVLLPAGTYLFEIQQPYSDKLICHGSISLAHKANGSGLPAANGHLRKRNNCPWFSLHVRAGASASSERFNDGAFVYTITTTSDSSYFYVKHRFPGITFTTERPLSSYRGTVKITKLK